MFLIMSKEWPWTPKRKLNLSGLDKIQMETGNHLVFDLTHNRFYDWTKAEWQEIQIADKNDPELKGSPEYARFFTNSNNGTRLEQNQGDGADPVPRHEEP